MADRLLEAIKQAREIADDLPEPYRPVAFQVAVNYFLGGSAVATKPGLRQATASMDMELNEFLASKKIGSHPDRIVAVAYYQLRKGAGGVTTKDIADAYARARLRKPQNVHDVISTTIRRGFLVDGEKKDGMRTWVITPTGEAHVEGELSQ